MKTSVIDLVNLVLVINSSDSLIVRNFSQKSMPRIRHSLMPAH